MYGNKGDSQYSPMQERWINDNPKVNVILDVNPMRIINSNTKAKKHLKEIHFGINCSLKLMDNPPIVLLNDRNYLPYTFLEV